MMLRLLLALCLMIGVAACSSMDDTLDPQRPEGIAANATPESIYNAGVDAMQAEQFARAAALFDLIEREHPYSSWAVNAQLMAAYAEYQRNRYTEAIGALERFIQLNPAHQHVAYAYYLRALSYYEQIADVRRDQQGTVNAMSALQDVVNRFPDTAYARDARLKIDLARDHLAGKEMEIGRWYQGQRLYTAAIGRFRRVIEQFQTTNYVPEALHRLTEIYLTLGLTDEARKTASVLGHNFPGSEWYQDSYALLVDGAEGVPAQRGFFGRTLDSVTSIF